MEMDMRKVIDSLRAAAAFLEAHPEMQVPSISADYAGVLKLCWTGDVTEGKSVDTVAGQAAFAKIVGGKMEKLVDSNYFRLRAVRDDLVLETLGYRKTICEEVQVGVKVEPEHIVPAVPEQIVPEREVPIYEWRCPSLLAQEEPAHADPE
jgi:hypothetical protein